MSLCGVVGEPLWCCLVETVCCLVSLCGVV